MSLLDGRKNLTKVLVDGENTAIATAILLETGEGGQLPSPITEGQYNLTWWDLTSFPDPSDDPNVELVRVTAIAGDTITVVRAQEGSAATSKNTAGHSYAMVLAATKKLIDDMELNLVTQSSNFAVAGGVANAYTATLPVTLLAYPTGLTINLKINVTNTGASTLNVNGLGVKTIASKSGALIQNDLKIGTTAMLVYDGTDFRLVADGIAQRASAMITLLDNATVTTLAVVSVPVKVSGTYTGSNLTNFTHLAGTLTFTGDNATKFVVSYSCSTASASANKQLAILVAKNGAAITTEKNTDYFNTAIDPHSMSFGTFVTLNTGDTIEAWLQNDTANTNATVSQLQLLLREVR